MFIEYDELELLEFFEGEPVVIGEFEAGNVIYSYKNNNFKMVLLISTYEMYIKISITYNDNVVYCQKHDDILAINKVDTDNLKVIGDKKSVVILKKSPQIGVIIQE